MNILRRYREYRQRREYERDVLFRMNHMPYGDMYGQVMAYRRARVDIKQEENKIRRAPRQPAI